MPKVFNAAVRVLQVSTVVDGAVSCAVIVGNFGVNGLDLLINDRRINVRFNLWRVL